MLGDTIGDQLFVYVKWFAHVLSGILASFTGRSETLSPLETSAPLLRLWSRKSTVGVPGHRGFMEIPCLGEGQPITLSPLHTFGKLYHVLNDLP